MVRPSAVAEPPLGASADLFPEARQVRLDDLRPLAR